MANASKKHIGAGSQGKGDGMVRDFGDAVVRYVRDPDAVVRCRINRDVVESHPEPRYDLEA